MLTNGKYPACGEPIATQDERRCTCPGCGAEVCWVDGKPEIE